MGKRAKKPAIVLPPPDTTEKPLNARQELFCIYFTRPRSVTFNNATLSYAEAYDYNLQDLSKDRPKKKKGKKIQKSPYDLAFHTCAVEASKALKKPDIHKRITERLNELYGSETDINAQLASIAYQTEDRSVGLSAIRDINKLRKRIGPNAGDGDETDDDIQPISSLQIIMPPGTKVKMK